MSESEITDVYNKMLEDLVRLCRILLNYQMIHGVDAEDIVQRVVLRALEKKEQLANHKNLYGWFVNACKLECITLARRSRIERRRLGISLPLEPEILIEKQQDELIQWLRKSEMNELLEELQARLTPLEKSVYHHITRRIIPRRIQRTRLVSSATRSTMPRAASAKKRQDCYSSRCCCAYRAARF